MVKETMLNRQHLSKIIIIFIAVSFATKINPCVIIKKPNIYLYPTEPQMVKIKLYPKGKIITSTPQYNKGWEVMAFPDGNINGTQEYLFYEAIIDIPKQKKGWCIRSNKIEPFFKLILKKYGFNKKEIKDFLKYWQNHLPNSPFCNIYPLVTKEINTLCLIKIKPQPDKLLRVWFIFEPQNRQIMLDEPQILTCQRQGFVVTEWGGIIKD